MTAETVDNSRKAAAAHPGAPGSFGRGRGAWVLFAVLLLVALVLRLINLGGEDLWFDELWSLLNAEGRQEAFVTLPLGQVLREPVRLTDPIAATSLGDLWRGMRLETHPPLYFIALHYWRAAFGDGRFALRLLSALCSALTIPFVALAVRRLSASPAWLWTTGFLAVAAADLQMAQSLRHYAPAGLFVAASFWLVSRWAPCPVAGGGADGASAQPLPSWRRWDLWAYVLAVLCAMLTHYMSALPLAGQAAYASLTLPGRARRIWAASVVVAAGAFAAAWGPSLVAQWRNVRDSTEPVVSLDTQSILSTPLEVLNAPIRLLLPVRELSVSLGWLGLDRARFLGDVRSDSAAVACLGGVLLALLAWGGRRRRGPALFLFGLWFAVPLLLLALAEVISGRSLIHHLRYPYFALPGLMGVIPLALSGLKARRGAIVLTVLGAVALGMTAIGYPTRSNPEATAAAQFVEAELSSEDLIVCDGFSAPPYWPRRLFLLLNHHAVRPLPAVVLVRAAPDESLLVEMATFKRLAVLHGWDDMEHVAFPPQFDRGEVISRHFLGLGWFVRLEQSGTPPRSDQP